ncbi:MAG: ABC transporter ATP-binding protein [Candidatus Eremiobacteraeota bacterium]|nr:ABC transporter ATP-binding protein [Candidatus Eremiobacteraeota bacterium]
MSTALPSPAIETRDIAKTYGNIMALRDLTLSVGKGEIFGFLGPNGAGKTTAVKVLLSLTRATAGRGNVLGKPIGDIETRRNIGYLPELFRYQEWATAREVLEFHAALLRLPRRERKASIHRVLELVDLSTRANHRIGTFSKGMQQRLGLAVALVGEPQLVILDEPTSALDPVGRHDVRKIIGNLRNAGMTVFLNSHLLSEVESVCDRIAVLDRGHVIACGGIDELLGRFALRVRFAITPTDGVITLLRQYSVEVIDSSSYLFRGIDEDDVPEFIRRMVFAGARLQSVEPVRSTLEDRFLQLLKDERAGPTHSIASSA